VGPTKVVANIGYRSSDEEARECDERFTLNKDVEVSFNAAGAECNPREEDSP